jgi:CubicO group peptidase (beta-lactamase class C family)
MKKFLKVFLIGLVVIVLIVLLYVLVSFPPIMRGMAAKTMCSCVFVSGRSPESVLAKELQVFPGLSDVPLQINHTDSTVTASLLWKEGKAIYRRGLGCTLLAEADEETIRKQRFIPYRPNAVNTDTIPWPAGDRRATSDDFTINRNSIDRVVENAFRETDPEKPVNTHAVVILFNEKIISERYAEGFDRNSVLMGWSMTKSIVNALIGILVKQGKLNAEVRAPVAAWQNDDRKNITLNHLLQASSGLEWSESYFLPGADFHNMFIHSDDKAGYAISRDLVRPPGSFFQYSSGSTNILSKIIRETVGDEFYHRFPYEALFSKIGMHHAQMEPDASGTFVASSYGYASARDWARFGLLYLNDGIWNGERILPEGWVKYSTTPAPAARLREYGAHIWLNLGEEDHPENVKFPGLPHESIIFNGFEENYVVIIPSRKLVVVRLGVTHNDSFKIEDLVNGIVDLLPEANNLARN